MTVTTPSPTSTDPEIRTDATIFGPLGAAVRCDIYEPAPANTSGWSIVVCPGYGSVKELMAEWGMSLSSLGHRVLVVGYRGYGEPSQELGRIFPQDHVDDARAAVRFMRTANSNKVALMGVSYGGAVAIEAAAREVKVDAVISIVGYGSGSRHLRALRSDVEWADLLKLVSADRIHRVETGQSDVITLDAILLRDEEGQAWRQQVEAEYPGMKFDVTVESVDRLLEFEPECHLPFRGDSRLLVIHAENDRVVPIEEARSIIESAGEPKRLVVLEGAEHHDVHTGVNFQRCLSEIGSHLKDRDVEA